MLGTHKITATMADKQPTYLTNDSLRPAARTRQRRIGGHHSRFFMGAVTLSVIRGGRTPRALLPERRRARTRRHRCGWPSFSPTLGLRGWATPSQATTEKTAFRFWGTRLLLPTAIVWSGSSSLTWRLPRVIALIRPGLRSLCRAW